MTRPGTYDVQSLRKQLDAFEKTYGITSAEFFEMRADSRDIGVVNGFDANVWSGTYENWMRLAGIYPRERA